MNLNEYLKQKQQRKDQEELNIRRRDYCLQCFRPQKACFCQYLIPFETNIEFCLLMHPMEARKERLGTGRLTHLGLKNSRIIVDINFDQNQEVQKIINSNEYFSILLYPGVDSLNLSDDKATFPNIENKKIIIFILDGTWPCAKSMMRDSLTLHNLPRMSFDISHRSAFHIKHQPADYCLSTIESVYLLIGELQKRGLEKSGNQKENLLKVFEKLVEFQIKCARDPSLNNYNRTSRPYKSPSQRVNSKKWSYRRICYEE